MPEQAPKFSLYSGEDESEYGTIKSAEKAEQISAAVMAVLQEQRQLNSFEDVATNPSAWSVFTYEYDQKLKREMDSSPENQTDHLVFASYRLQKAKAVEQYLYQMKLKGRENARQRAIFEELKLIAYAEAEQSMVTALYRAGDDYTVRKEMVALFVAIGASGWGNDMQDNLQRLRAGINLQESEQAEAAGLMRGVTGHAAAIEIMRKLLDCETYCPTVEIDGLHGIDFGARDNTRSDSKIDTTVQVKTRNKLENSDGVIITPVAASQNERIGFVAPLNKGAEVSADERLIHDRELAIGKLQAGMFWLKHQNMESVDNDNLVGLLLELRSSQYGRSFDEFESSEGCFDIQTGLCNYALCDAVARLKPAIDKEIALMRANSRSVGSSSLKINQRRRGKVGAA